MEKEIKPDASRWLHVALLTMIAGGADAFWIGAITGLRLLSDIGENRLYGASEQVADVGFDGV